MIAVQIAVFVGLLAGGSLLVERLPRPVAAALWVIVPVALMPHWIANAAIWHWSVFLWAKVLSVVLTCAWNAACLVRSPPPRVVAASLVLCVGVNILECVALDLTALEGEVAHWANAAAGVLLMLALPVLPGARVVREGPERRLVAPLSRAWIAAYTVWNLCFVYLNWDSYAFGQHLAFHGAALLLTWRGGAEDWYMARTRTLGIAFVLYLSFFGYFNDEFDTSTWSHAGAGASFAAVSLALALLATVRAWGPRRAPARSAANASRRLIDAVLRPGI
ncbi:MAG: DUF5692 family protein [Pseudomonadota bacterium]|nr:DUF5692 family protein [Pseudomonadota bacterium]